MNVMTISMPRRCLDRWIDRLLEHEPNWSAKENSCISFVILQCQLMPSIVIADDCRDLLQGDRALEDVRGHAQDNCVRGSWPQVMAGALSVLRESQFWRTHSGLEEVLHGQQDQGRRYLHLQRHRDHIVARRHHASW